MLLPLQRHIAQDIGYIDGSPVFSLAVLESAGSLIQKELTKELMLDSHC